MSDIKNLFDQNKVWAKNNTDHDPEYFTRLSNQQVPEYLWIGCSDSRVPANQIVNLAPGEVFVHRNIANVVEHTDLNCLSVIQFAVEVLKVKHIIVCGHYGCGGVKAALHNSEHSSECREVSFIDNWLVHIEDVKRFHKDKFIGLNHDQKLKLLCELNVIEQVKNVCKSSIISKAWNNGSKLSVHGWIYDINNGLIKDLKKKVSSNNDIIKKLDSV